MSPVLHQPSEGLLIGPLFSQSDGGSGWTSQRSGGQIQQRDDAVRHAAAAPLHLPQLLPALTVSTVTEQYQWIKVLQHTDTNKEEFWNSCRARGSQTVVLGPSRDTIEVLSGSRKLRRKLFWCLVLQEDPEVLQDFTVICDPQSAVISVRLSVFNSPCCLFFCLLLSDLFWSL